jgi:hypothetical protein
MATLVILQIQPVPADPANNAPATQAATFAVKSGGTAYRWTAGGFDASWSQAQIQSDLDAQSDQLFAAAQAEHAINPDNAPIITDAQILLIQRATAHLKNRGTFAQVLYKLDDAIDNATSLDLPTYQSVLSTALTALNELPQGFINNWTKYRTARGASLTPNSIAACQVLEQAIRSWIESRISMVTIAKDFDWWMKTD